MPIIRTRLVVPYGLTTLLEGVSRAAVVNHPEDITEFFTLYFQGLAAFRRGLLGQGPAGLAAGLLQGSSSLASASLCRAPRPGAGRSGGTVRVQVPHW